MTNTDNRIKELKRLLKEKKKEKKLELLKQYQSAIDISTPEQFKRLTDVLNTRHGDTTTKDYIKGVSQEVAKETPKPTATPTEPRHAMVSPSNTDMKTVASSTSPLAKK